MHVHVSCACACCNLTLTCAPPRRAVLSGVRVCRNSADIHRDIKPDNVLYSFETSTALVIDFGLAQPMRSDMASGSALGQHATAAETASRHVEHPRPPKRSLKALHQELHPKGLLAQLAATHHSGVNRVALASNPPRFDSVPRAGTPGFRPPEVLLRSKNQGYAVDVWAAGIIALSLATRRFPIFTGAKSDEDYLGQILLMLDMLQTCGNASGSHLIDAECKHDTKQEDSRLVYEKRPANHERLNIGDGASSWVNALQFTRDTNSEVDMWLYHLLNGCLRFDAAKRLTARQVLELQAVKNIEN